MADFRFLHDDHHPVDERAAKRAARAAAVAAANAAVDAFPAAPGPISAFVPAKGWSLSLPQDLVADIMKRAVREVRAESGVSAAARTVARLSRACPDFYAAAPAGWAAAAEGYDGNDGEVPSSMLVDPCSHSLPALRAACAAVGVPATTTLSKAEAIMALLGAHGLTAPLRAPVPSVLIQRVREEGTSEAAAARRAAAREAAARRAAAAAREAERRRRGVRPVPRRFLEWNESP